MREDGTVTYQWSDLERKHWRFEIQAAWGNGDWFTSDLFRLIAHADRVNRERIRQGFPEEVAVFEAWKRGEL